MRKELKFILDLSRASLLYQTLQLVCQNDSHCDASGSYQVTSVYFDDDFNTHLKEKIQGENKRAKLRIRYYGDKAQDLFAESKQKKGDWVVKKRMPLAPEVYAQSPLCPSYLTKDLTQHHTHQLRAKQAVTYRRRALVMDHTDVRLTFDDQIRVSVNREPNLLKDNTWASVYDENTVIFELKFSHDIPFAIWSILQNVGIKTAHSKYAIGRTHV